MPPNANAERRHLEWEALRALCASFDHVSGAADAKSADSLPLQEIHFLDPVHRAIFLEIAQCRLRSFSREQLQRRLPEAMTRLGFPDLDFDVLFRAAPADSAPVDIATIAHALAQPPGAFTNTHTPSRALRIANLVEPLAFAGFTALYIWWLQDALFWSWLIFPVWLVASFALHRDTPKTLGWRGDNLWPATRRTAKVFAAFAIALCIAGLALGTFKHFPAHMLDPRRFAGYFAFCTLQEVALQSLVMNRFLAAVQNRFAAALVAGGCFAALHWPNPVLIPVTFIGGTVFCWLFAKERNILPLILAQAILGSLVWWAFPVAWHHAMRVGPGFYTFHR